MMLRQSRAKLEAKHYDQKDGSGNRGVSAHLSPSFMAAKGLIHMKHTKDGSQYCPKCAPWNGRFTSIS